MSSWGSLCAEGILCPAGTEVELVSSSAAETPAPTQPTEAAPTASAPAQGAAATPAAPADDEPPPPEPFGEPSRAAPAWQAKMFTCLLPAEPTASACAIERQVIRVRLKQLDMRPCTCPAGSNPKLPFMSLSCLLCP